jgi:hypothetical protein
MINDEGIEVGQDRRVPAQRPATSSNQPELMLISPKTLVVISIAKHDGTGYQHSNQHSRG